MSEPRAVIRGALAAMSAAAIVAMSFAGPRARAGGVGGCGIEGRAADPRVIYGGSAQPGTFRAIRAAASTDAAVPDGVFMARFGIDPQDFLTVVAEVRGAG